MSNNKVENKESDETEGSPLNKLGARFIGVIDGGTNSISFTIYSTPDFKEVAKYGVQMHIEHPLDGWLEQDPKEIIKSIRICMKECISQLRFMGHKKKDISAIGITNQRETTVVWDRITGEPLYNAIIWSDIRTIGIMDQILEQLPDKNKNHFKKITGLPISPYFSALKIRWLTDNVASVRNACKERRCLAGTMDSWIVWNLTKGGLHITDVTNASRTLLMNIDTLNWDPLLLKTFGIDQNMLPEIRSSSEIYGNINDDSAMQGVPISAILGNQQASLLGQRCFKSGEAKTTYRTGCFLLCNTGCKPVISSHGLLTTVAYKLGKEASATYALEGAVAIAGHALKWLQHSVRLLPDAEKVEEFAKQVPTTADVYFVPAFTGLYAPYWRKDARGIICGLTQFSTKNHIVRAALEAICFQTNDIIACMREEGDLPLNKLYTDGALASSDLLMQLQADIAGVIVYRSQIVDTTTYGAALCAAQADGIDICKICPDNPFHDDANYDTFLPTTADDDRILRCTKWRKAVERSIGWIVQKKTNEMSDERYRLLSSISPALFLISSFAMLIHASTRAA